MNEHEERHPDAATASGGEARDSGKTGGRRGKIVVDHAGCAHEIFDNHHIRRRDLDHPRK